MGTLDLPRNLHFWKRQKKKSDFSAGGTYWQLHLQQLGPCMWCGVTPLQGLSPPAPPALGRLTPSLCGLCKNKWEKEPPQEGETPGLRGWWLEGGCAGAAADGGVARGRVSQCPSCVPTTSCRTAAATRSEPPAQNCPGGFCPLRPPPVPHPPGPARPQLPGGMTLCPPGWAPQRWFPLPEQRGAGRAGHGRERAGIGTGPWQGRGWEPGHCGTARDGDSVPGHGDRGSARDESSVSEDGDQGVAHWEWGPECDRGWEHQDGWGQGPGCGRG